MEEKNEKSENNSQFNRLNAQMQKKKRTSGRM